MPKNSLTEEAFDILADELGEQLSAVRGMVARAAQAADYDGAEEALNRAKSMICPAWYPATQPCKAIG